MRGSTLSTSTALENTPRYITFNNGWTGVAPNRMVKDTTITVGVAGGARVVMTRSKSTIKISRGSRSTTLKVKDVSPFQLGGDLIISGTNLGRVTQIEFMN